MTKREENKRSSYVSIDQLFLENQAITASVAALQTAYDKLKNRLVKINETNRLLDSATAGKRQVKQNAEAALIDVLVPVASALVAYAGTNGNPELKANARVTRSSLQGLRDTILVDQATTIHGLATANLPALADYNISEATLTDLQVRIGTFTSAMKTRELSASDRKALRSALTELFRETDELLKSTIDPLIEMLKIDQPLFYSKYKSARMIRDLGHGARAPEPAVE